jgi:hypothetical protein
MAGKPKFTSARITEALIRCKGLIYLAAKELRCDPSTVHRRIQRNEKLKGIVERERGEFCDTAELALLQAVLRGEAWAVCFTLKTQAKHRGYVERSEVRQESRVTLTTSAEALTDDELAAIATGRGKITNSTQDSETQSG